MEKRGDEGLEVEQYKEEQHKLKFLGGFDTTGDTHPAVLAGL